jgi:hypothetical protein
MARITRRLVVLALILLGAGIAAAQSSLIAGPPAGISSPSSPLTQTAPPVTATPSTTGGVTTTTVGDTTTVTGTSTMTPTATSTSPTVPGATVAIQQVVSLTRTVEAGTPVSAFAVPAGTRLVVTDVIITNPGTAAACGASVAASGTTTTASAPAATTSTTSATTASAVTANAAVDLASTGVLCVPAQTSLTLALSTGLEFAGGQQVLLANQVVATGGSASSGPLFYHLRGFLISGAV